MASMIIRNIENVWHTAASYLVGSAKQSHIHSTNLTPLWFFNSQLKNNLTSQKWKKLSKYQNQYYEVLVDAITISPFVSHHTRRAVSEISMIIATYLSVILSQRMNDQTLKYSISACSLSTNDRFLLVGGWKDNDKKNIMLTLYDIETWNILRIFTSHTTPIRVCALSASNRQALAAGTDSSILIWCVQTQTCTHTWCGHLGLIHRCWFSPDETHVLSASQDGEINVWHVASKNVPIQTIQAPNHWNFACAVSFRYNFVVVAGWNGSINIFDLDSAELLRTTVGHHEWIINCFLNTLETQIISAGRDEYIKIWNVSSMECVRILPRQLLSNTMNIFSLCHDDMWLVASTWDHKIKLINIVEERIVEQYQAHTDAIRTCEYSQNSHSILSTSFNDSVRIFFCP